MPSTPRRAWPAWAPPWFTGAMRWIEAAPLVHRLARGAFWSLASGVVTRGLTLLASIVVARLLGREAFGALGVVQSTIGMFAVFSGLGLGLTATKHLAELRTADPARAGRLLALSSRAAVAGGAAFALVLLALAPWLARTLAAPELVTALQIAAALLFATSIQGAQQGALAGLEAFRTLARVSLVSGLLAFPLTIAGAWLGGVNGALAGLAAGAAIGAVLHEIAVRAEARAAGVSRARGWRREDFAVLWRFSLPAVLAQVLVGPVHWACAAMLVNAPGGYAAMGAFNAANQWFLALLFVPALLSQAALPLMAERIGADARDQSVQVVRWSMAINALTVVPVLVLSVLAPVVMGLYGEEFRGEWPTLILVLATAGLLAVQTPVGQLLLASGRVWAGFAMNLGWAVVYLAATWWLVDLGARGLALARLLAYAVHAVWTFGYAYAVLRAPRTRAPR